MGIGPLRGSSRTRRIPHVFALYVVTFHEVSHDLGRKDSMMLYMDYLTLILQGREIYTKTGKLTWSNELGFMWNDIRVSWDINDVRFYLNEWINEDGSVNDPIFDGPELGLI